MARAQGGRETAQVCRAAAAVAPMVIIIGALFQYVALDYSGTLVASFVIRLINSEEALWCWWLAWRGHRPGHDDPIHHRLWCLLWPVG